jgi:hypothetical protein
VEVDRNAKLREMAQRIVDLTVAGNDEGSLALYSDAIESKEAGNPPSFGLDAIKQKFVMWRGMVSDAAFLPRSVLADGNTIVIEWDGKVTLAATAPDDFTIDEYHPDIEKDDLGPAIEAKLGSALFARVGVPSPVPVGAFFDAFPLSVLTTSTLERAESDPRHAGLDSGKPRQGYRDRYRRGDPIEKRGGQHRLPGGTGIPGPHPVLQGLEERHRQLRQREQRRD